MNYSPGTQKLVDQAERIEKARRARRRTYAAVVGSQRWTGSESQKTRESRQRSRGKLELLRYNLRKARERSRADVAALRARQRESRPALRAAIAKFRAKWRAWVNAQVAEFKAKHRGVWRGRIDSARLALVRAQFELDAELGYQRELRATARAVREARRAEPKAKRTGKLHRAESDYYVEANLPPELVPVWRKVKNRIKTSSAYQSRVEAFLGWVHDSPREVAAIRERLEREQSRNIDREMSEAEAAYYRREGYG